MSELHLRALERAAQGGDPEARVRLLGERLRCGVVSRERVALGAYLGDPLSLAVSDAAVGPEGYSALIAGLWRWGRPALVRAAVAAGRAWLPGWERECGWEAVGDDGALALRYVEGAEWPRAAEETAYARRELEALEAWVACPCKPHARAARESRDAALSPMAAVGCALEEGPGWIERATEASLRVAAAQLGSEAVRAALVEALGTWARGESDPVRTQRRLPRIEPQPAEWERRGWEVTWEGTHVRVALGTWSARYEAPDREGAVRGLDLELWESRRWLAPRTGIDVDPFRALNAWAVTRQWELRSQP